LIPQILFLKFSGFFIIAAIITSDSEKAAILWKNSMQGILVGEKNWMPEPTGRSLGDEAHEAHPLAARAQQRVDLVDTPDAKHGWRSWIKAQGI
jgi:hypothetical protein